MKFLKLDLLTLLISLFLLSACESTSTIGLEVDPTIALDGSLIDSLTVSSRTVVDDPGQTYILERHPFGYLKDPVLGTTTANLAMTVNLPADAYDFGVNPVLDSAVLVLNYGGEFYGDSTSTYSFEVRQLANDLSDETSFLSNKAYPTNNTIVGSKSGRIYPTTRYKVLDLVTGGKDTTRTVSPQLRIKLDPLFIQESIVDLAAAEKKYNYRFKQAFKGLHLQINKNTTSGNGGIMFFDFASSNSSLSLYYRRRNASNSALTDTVGQQNFPISSSTTNGTNPVVASIVHDYAGTPVATQLANPNQQFAVTYLQPLGGLRNKLTFPYLKNLASNVGKIAINKAELVIDVNSGTDAGPYYSAPRLALYKYDLAEQRRNIPDNNASASGYIGDPRALSPTVFGGYFNPTTKQYVFVVTSYIQDLLDGKTENYGTFLAPTPLSSFTYLTSSFSSAGRAVIGSHKKNPATGDPNMKVRIYYTKIN